MICSRVVVVLVVSLSVLWPGPLLGDHAPEGRWVDFGPWNGIVDCESAPTVNGPPLSDHPEEVRVDQLSPTADFGAFQFQQRTWDWVAQWRGRTDLVGVDPRTVDIGEQFDQAKALAFDIHGGGIQHWTCGYRYGDGTGPRFVTAEVAPVTEIAVCLELFADLMPWAIPTWELSPYYETVDDCGSIAHD